MGEERQGTCPVTAVYKLTYYLNVFSPLTINIKCIAMQVNVQYNCGKKNYYIRTPWRKKAVRRLARRRDSMFTSAPLTSIAGRKSTISTVARAVQEELKVLCSTNHDSILRDSIEAVKHFSWETVWLELCKMLPTLMSLLMELVRHPTDNKPLLCLLASMLLKKRSPGLGLLQRAITVALYGNGAHKAVSHYYNVSDSASFTTINSFR